MRNAVPVGHEIRPTILLEVPEDLLRESADACRQVSRKTVGDVVARQHETVDPREEFGFVTLDPGQLRGREVPRRIERMTQTAVAADPFERLLADSDGPRIAPDDRLAKRVPLPVEAHQPVHLIGDAHRNDLAQRMPGADLPDPLADVVPPHLGILFGPTRLQGLDGHLLRGVRGRSHTLARLNLQQRHLYR